MEMDLTQEEIITGNKLIAEFITIEIKDGWYYFDHPIIHEAELAYFKNFRFHSSWDWLMPVVEKIEEMGHYTVMGIECYDSVKFDRKEVELYFSPNQSYLLHLKIQNYKVESDTWKHPMYKFHIIKQFDFRKHGRLLGLWFAIVEFIKWYKNERK